MIVAFSGYSQVMHHRAAKRLFLCLRLREHSNALLYGLAVALPTLRSQKLLWNVEAAGAKFEGLEYPSSSTFNVDLQLWLVLDGNARVFWTRCLSCPRE